jgi:hypothetical protein
MMQYSRAAGSLIHVVPPWWARRVRVKLKHRFGTNGGGILISAAQKRGTLSHGSGQAWSKHTRNLLKYAFAEPVLRSLRKLEFMLQGRVFSC